MTEKHGWIGVDLDGTLAFYDPSDWKEDCIGKPIPLMVERINNWLTQGYEVKIFTARYHSGPKVIGLIKDWLESVGLPRLEVTATKDYAMLMLYDDRCTQVKINTGELITNDRVKNQQ